MFSEKKNLSKRFHSLSPAFRSLAWLTSRILYGDEYGRSQRGCNNGWCQDARCWFSWSSSKPKTVKGGWFLCFWCEESHQLGRSKRNPQVKPRVFWGLFFYLWISCFGYTSFDPVAIYLHFLINLFGNDNLPADGDRLWKRLWFHQLAFAC